MERANLPAIVEEILDPISNDEQRQMALLSTLAILPVVFENAGYRIKGFHGLNQGVIILAPPASGKGIVADVSRIISPLNSEIQRQNKARISRRNGQTFIEGRRNLITPANITASRLVEQLAENQNRPLAMVDTEVDSLISSWRGEHGRQLSSILRKALEQEPVAMERRKDLIPLSVERPWLTVVLCGTLDQFHSLLNGNSDGLHSRLMFLRSEGSMDYIPTLPSKKGETLEDRYAEIGKRMMAVHQTFEEVEIEITFTDKQWDERNQLGAMWNESFKALGYNALSIPRRGANHLMKFAGSLTLIRNCETAPLGSTVTWECTDEDFATARRLVENSLECSREIFIELSKSAMTRSRKNEVELLSRLDNEFHTDKALKTGLELGFSESTVKRLLRDLTDSTRLQKVGHGHYRKNEAQQVGPSEIGADLTAKVEKDQNVTKE